MRLGVDLACLATARTGAGVYVREITAALRRLAGEGELIELAPGGYPVTGGAAAKIWNNFRLLAWIQWQLPARARRAGCGALLSPEYLAPARAGMPRIVVVYDAAFARRPREYHPLWRWLFRRVYLPAMRRAEAVATISEAAKREIVQAYGLRPERVAVIPPACDRERFRIRPAQEMDSVLRKYGLQPRRYFLHVGVMEKRKNLPRLIRAFAAVSARNPEVSLVLAGQPGPKRDLDDSGAIASEIRKCGLSDKVLLPGFLPSEDLPLLYQGAAAMVFPTLYEGFGIPVLEALACGTAVACSDLPVLREVAGPAAVYFAPEDEAAMAQALAKVRKDPALGRQLLQAGRERVVGYSWERSAKSILDLARGLAEKVKVAGVRA